MIDFFKIFSQTPAEQAAQDEAQARILEEESAWAELDSNHEIAQRYAESAQLLRARAAQYAELIEREAA